MDGDTAPLAELSALARDFQATLLVDEAHALGVLGPNGRGLCQQAGVIPDVLVGTLGKAFGSFGGFVAGSTLLRTYLLNRSRSFVFTTAVPPPVAAAALAGVQLALSEEGQRRRARLLLSVEALTAVIRDLPLSQRLAAPGPIAPPMAAPILPIILGPDSAAVAASAKLDALGLFVPAIRPPTVPDGTSRLRVTLSAAHEDADVARLTAGLRVALA